MIKIDKAKPVGEVHNPRGRPPKYPFREMEVGDSFLVDLDGKRIEGVRQSVIICARSVFGGPGFISTKSVMKSGEKALRVTRTK